MSTNSPQQSILVYTKNDCKYCTMAKKLLKKLGEWNITKVVNNMNMDKIHEKHDDIPSTHCTFPVIIINGKFFGGWTELHEPVLDEEESGYVFPQRDKIKYPDILALAERHEAVIWPLSEVHGFEDDARYWKTLDTNKKNLIKNVLAFFAAADGLVLDNINLNFYQSFSAWSIKMMYAVQSYMEGVHAKTYSELIYNFIKDPHEVDSIIESTKNNPAVRKKAEWALKWMNSDERPLLLRLIAFVFIEGCFFSSSFASIFWLERDGLRGALTFSNLLISRDEGIHEEAGCLIASKFKRRADEKIIHEMAREAIEIECEFARQIIPNRMNGMNADLMEQHVKFIGDRILKGLGYSPLYDVESPFPNIMQSIRIMGNFFEKKIHEYTAANDMRITTEESF